MHLAAQCAPTVAVATMQALVQHESHARPYAIHVNGRAQLSRQPLNKDEAVQIAGTLRHQGYSFDMGLGQINNANLAKLNLSVDQVFEPCANLKAAATVLHWCYDPAAVLLGPGQAALKAGLSCYNTGDFTEGLQNGYVAGIYRAASVLYTFGGHGRITGTETERFDSEARSDRDD